MRRTSFVLALILLFQTNLQAEDFLARKIAKLGQPAPAFELQDLGESKISLASNKGKVVMLHFWSAQCPFVVRYEERLKNIALDYRSKDVVVIGIDSNSTETPEQIKKTAVERELSYALLLDPDHKVADDYGAITTPHVYIIDKEGNLAYEGAVDDQGWAEKNPVTKNYTREALDALLAGQPVPTPETKTFGCTVKRSQNH